jgi:WD40 repeat protein
LQCSDLSQVYFKPRALKKKGLSSKDHGITVLKFSPDGHYLAVGSKDKVVNIYEVPSGMKLFATCKGHSSFISHLDWSSDGSFLQTNSGDYELLYWNALTGKKAADATAMKDTKWSTQCCVLGWSVQGIWEKGMDGTDITWVDRNADSTCLVSGDDMLNIRLHSYPATKENVS